MANSTNTTIDKKADKNRAEEKSTKVVQSNQIFLKNQTNSLSSSDTVAVTTKKFDIISFFKAIKTKVYKFFSAFSQKFKKNFRN